MGLFRDSLNSLDERQEEEEMDGVERILVIHMRDEEMKRGAARK
jgi:hypothetical protein